MRLKYFSYLCTSFVGMLPRCYILTQNRNVTSSYLSIYAAEPFAFAYPALCSTVMGAAHIRHDHLLSHLPSCYHPHAFG